MKKNYLFFIGLLFWMGDIFAQTFQEVSVASGINFVYKQSALMGGGAVWFDYDKDNKEDLYIVGGNKSGRLFRNNGNGTFTDKTVASGLLLPDSTYTTGAVAGDIDNDGDKDLFITTWGKYFFYSDIPNLLFKNNGNGTFTNISVQAGITQKAWSSSASLGDYNLDGYLDIFVVNYIDTAKAVFNANNQIVAYAHVPQPDFLYLNNHNNTFSEVAVNRGVADMGIGLGVAFTDFDFDHDVDVYVCNDFGQWLKSSTLYQNNYPTDDFTDIGGTNSIDSRMFGMGVAIGDYDEDGDLDYYETNIGRNKLYRNDGGGVFSDVATPTGTENEWISFNRTATGWSAMFGDFNNDSYLDLYVNNGYMESSDSINVPISANHNYNALFKNNGNGTFTDIAASANVKGGYLGRGAAMSDYDNDGDLDIVSVVQNYFPVAQDTVGNSPHILLFKNNNPINNTWLKVKLKGIVNNYDGYGSRITVYKGNRKWIREIDGGSGHASQNSSIAHFGLGSNTTLDSVRVDWLGGCHQSVKNVIANQTLTFVEACLTDVMEANNYLSYLHFYPNPAQNTAYLSFYLAQNAKVEILIMNHLGQVIKSISQYQGITGKQEVPITTEELPTGIYQYAIKIDGYIKGNGKFVKE